MIETQEFRSVLRERSNFAVYMYAARQIGIPKDLEDLITFVPDGHKFYIEDDQEWKGHA